MIYGVFELRPTCPCQFSYAEKLKHLKGNQTQKEVDLSWVCQPCSVTISGCRRKNSKQTTEAITNCLIQRWMIHFKVTKYLFSVTLDDTIVNTVASAGPRRP